jgi:SAM-dependent methyltransferase
MLAADSVALVRRHRDLAGQTVLDVGGGAGYFAEEFRRNGAACLLVERDRGEFARREDEQGGSDRIRHDTVVGDGYWLPVADGSVDVCFSSNVLEHVPDPGGFLDEMIRATRPGGVVYLSYTVWLSPWGGHETSPWHYLGGRYAARRYERRHGRPPKNLFGTTMFALDVASMLRLIRGRTDVTVLEMRPRYHPRWCRFLLAVPGLREVLTWNLLIILRRER